MFYRIFKNDFKRKKTMNIILMLFIILSTVFVSSGLSSLFTVMNGMDYFFDKAGIGDYVVVTMGGNCVGCLDDLFKDEDAINSYKIEPVVYTGQKSVSDLDGNELKTKNTTIIQSIETSKINFFDEDNNVIEEVKKGYVYPSGVFLTENNLNIGDKIVISHCGVELTLTIEGMAKDAVFGSNNYRFVISDEDIRNFLDNEEIYNYYRGEMCYIETDNITEVSSILAGASNIAFEGPRSMIKMGFVIDIIIVLLSLILSICLILVSFIVLKFSITFSIAEEYREIGMLKAIGLQNRKIRFLYIIKYLVLGLVGAIIGVFISFPIW